MLLRWHPTTSIRQVEACASGRLRGRDEVIVPKRHQGTSWLKPPAAPIVTAA